MKANNADDFDYEKSFNKLSKHFEILYKDSLIKE